LTNKFRMLRATTVSKPTLAHSSVKTNSKV
jgi:hypothetical protein